MVDDDLKDDASFSAAQYCARSASDSLPQSIELAVAAEEAIAAADTCC